MKKKILWKIIFILGLIPFVLTLIVGIYFSIIGFSGIYFGGSYYGLNAFIDSIIYIGFLYYPIYIVGFILIIMSIIKINKNK